MLRRVRRSVVIEYVNYLADDQFAPIQTDGEVVSDAFETVAILSHDPPPLVVGYGQMTINDCEVN